MHLVYSWLIPGLWIAWLIYWFAASVQSKPVTRQESFASSALHRVPLLIAVFLFLPRPHPHVLGWLGLRFLPRSVALFWVGTIIVAAGLGWSVLARVYLGGNWSSGVTVKREHELIRTGPYQWTRHPIYTGLIAAFGGSAIALGEWRGLVALALVVAAFWRKSVIEERFMMAQFPAAYPSYRAEVPALVPFPLRLRHRTG
jgi:protein-S-isoprenylcysteine O-methyltransferase Ste14